MNYVMHICRNPKCNNGWIDKDLTNAQINPPDWKYCRECAKNEELTLTHKHHYFMTEHPYL